MQIAITAPVYLATEGHKQYYDITVNSLKCDEHTLRFIPVLNYLDPKYPLESLRPPENPSLEITFINGRQPQSVSKAWNTGIREAERAGADYVLVINTDIKLAKGSLTKLINFASRHDAVLYSMAAYGDLDTLDTIRPIENYHEHPHFSCFLVRADFLDVMGNFDENFERGYFEDNDMMARIALSGNHAYIYGGALFYHYGSRTLGEDAELRNSNQPHFEHNRNYFIEKWGSPVLGEVSEIRRNYFKHPYNDDSKPLSYWR